MRTHTHTCVKLTVTQETYEEIAEALKKAGYEHVFVNDGFTNDGIDMTGIMISPFVLPSQQKDKT